MGDSGTVLRYDGSQWHKLATPTNRLLRGVWGRSPRDVWVVGDSGTALHWDGRAWSYLAPPTQGALRAVRGIGSDIYAVGANGSAYKWDGVTWTTIASGLPVLLVGMDVVNGGFIAVGDLAAILDGH